MNDILLLITGFYRLSVWQPMGLTLLALIQSRWSGLNALIWAQLRRSSLSFFAIHAATCRAVSDRFGIWRVRGCLGQPTADSIPIVRNDL